MLKLMKVGSLLCFYTCFHFHVFSTVCLVYTSVLSDGDGRTSIIIDNNFPYVIIIPSFL